VKQSLTTFAFKVLKKLKKENISTISSQLFGVRVIQYPELEKILDPKYKRYFQELINTFEELNLVEKEIKERVIACPRCGSLNVVAFLTCPRCKSSDIEPVDVLSHVTCGYSGISTDFRKNGKLICPNCGEELKEEGKDYYVLGRVFYCHKCSLRTSSPIVNFRCLDKGHVFSLEEVNHRPLYNYVIVERAVEEFEKINLEKVIEAVLVDSGYKVEKNAVINGLSLIQHKFNMIASRNNKKICIDYLLENDPRIPLALTSAYGKSADLREHTVVLVVPARSFSSDTIKSFSRGNLKVILYNSIDEVREKLSKVIKELETVRK